MLGQARAAGFTTVQYNWRCSGLEPLPARIAPTVLTNVEEAVAQSGVEIVAVSATYNMVHPDRRVRAQGLARLAVVAEAAQRLSIPLVTLCTGTRDPDDQWAPHPDNASAEAWADLLVAMEAAIAIAERHEVELGVEPEPGNVVSSAERAQALLRELRSSRLRIVFDPANLIAVGAPSVRRAVVADAAERLAASIVLVHAKDRTTDGGATAAGQGVLDYAHLAGCLREIGYDGAVVTHELAPVQAPGVAAFLTRTFAAAGVALQPPPAWR